MAKLRKVKNPRTVGLRRLVARKDRPDGKATKGEPARHVIEFPKPTVPDDVVSGRIIFEVGEDRFTVKWTTEIEPLPRAGPVEVEGRQTAHRGLQTSRDLPFTRAELPFPTAHSLPLRGASEHSAAVKFQKEAVIARVRVREEQRRGARN